MVITNENIEGKNIAGGYGQKRELSHWASDYL
jgi:hypothetical protein